MRDPSGFWLGYALPLAYAAAAHGGGAYALLTRSRAERSAAQCALAVLAVAHGRVVATYLVHEAAHSAIFKSLRANTATGVLCQWMCVVLPALPRARTCCARCARRGAAAAAARAARCTALTP